MALTRKAPNNPYNIFQLEKDNVLIGDTWTGGEGESEGESVDSEGEDSLQLAGVYTVEEVIQGDR